MSSLRERIKSANMPLQKLRKFKILYQHIDEDGDYEDMEELVEFKGDSICCAVEWAYGYAYGLTDKHPFKIMEEITEPHHRHGRMVSYWVQVADLYTKF